MECLPPPDAADDALGCECRRRAAPEGTSSEADVDRLKRENNRTAAEESLRVFSLRVF